MSNTNPNPVQIPNPTQNPVLTPTLTTGTTKGDSATFTCKACGATFKSQDELQKHNQDQHSGKMS